jgi:hypothetical protein
MIKVTVKNKLDQVTNEAVFANEELADAWIAENELTQAFGKPGRWIFPANFKGESAEDADDTRLVESPTGNRTEYFFGPDYFVSKTDVTAELDFEALWFKCEKRQAYGAKLVAFVFAVNQAKFEAGTLDAEKFQAFLSNSTLTLIERLLFNGSLDSAKALIQSLDTTYFSAGEKAQFIAKLDAFKAEADA